MKRTRRYSRDIRVAKAIWGDISKRLIQSLTLILSTYRLSVSRGDLLLLNGGWYITHSGLLRIATRKHCFGMRVLPATEMCDARTSRYVFRATVYTSIACKGFMGYGDADPSNVSPLMHGAEMRVAETRAVNRALRKAYGIGICSGEEIGFVSKSNKTECQVRELSPVPANGNGTRVRDRLCQLIRQHSLDAELVKAYATDFCGTKLLREATREQIENFVAHLANWAEKDRNALLCQLNSYSRQQGIA